MQISPFPYTIDGVLPLVIVLMSGTVHGAQIAATYRTMYRDPGFGPRFDVLWDATAITELLFEPDDLGSFVRLHEEFGDVASSGRDILVVRRPLDKAMADVYLVMMKKQPRAVHVCRSRSEADVILHQRGTNP
jgi:hypothetical protein